MLFKSALILFFLLTSLSTYAQTCPNLSIDEQAQIASIHDGDTLRLKDGRRIRLIAINTPELAQAYQPAQALAKEATQAARDFFSDTTTVQLHFSQRKKDRYGRILAHVSHPVKGSLEQHLVSLGLAFPIAVPPDFLLSSCLSKISDQARKNHLGIWANNYWSPLSANNLAKVDEGFRRVCGVVSKVDRSGSLWIELQGDLVIKINVDDEQYFVGSDFDLDGADHWLGKKIELWAWLQNRSHQKNLMQRGFKPWVAQVRSPHMLRWTSSCN